MEREGCRRTARFSSSLSEALRRERRRGGVSASLSEARRLRASLAGSLAGSLDGSLGSLQTPQKPLGVETQVLWKTAWEGRRERTRETRRVRAAHVGLGGEVGCVGGRHRSTAQNAQVERVDVLDGFVTDDAAPNVRQVGFLHVR